MGSEVITKPGSNCACAKTALGCDLEECFGKCWAYMHIWNDLHT